MRISLVDRSHYYKGLLVLIGKDRIIDQRERGLMLRFGQILDFDQRFCEAAIEDLLDNKYITGEPLIFANREIAECFLRDAVRLALVDEEIHSHELAWLKAIAQANNITDEWLDADIHHLQEQKRSLDHPTLLNIQQYL